MKRALIFLYVIGLCIGTAWSVNALTLSSVEGNWTGIAGGGGTDKYKEKKIGYGNGLEDQVLWGSGGKKSGLGFTGLASSVAPLSFDSGEAFTIGQLRHFNNPISSWSAASEAFLDISMTFADPYGRSVFDFTFGIDETPNIYDDPVKDADEISISDGYSSEIFVYAGIEYTFELLGFGNTADGLLPSFTSPERGTNSTKLWGKITALNPVPEPTTMLLFGFGLLGFANVARRKLG